MKVLILTEGGKEKGFGHITRCISIAQGFVYLNKIKPSNIKFLVNSDLSVKQLLTDFSNVEFFNWLVNADKIFEKISKEHIVIIDSYYAPYGLLKEISENAGLCVYIDDYNRIDYPNGIIVNGTIGAENIEYNKKEGRTYLLGINYAYLRKEFWDVQRNIINKKLKKVLITFGGNDMRNMIPKVQKFLKKYDFEKYIFVTDAMENIEKIKENLDERTKLILNPEPEKIIDIMLDVDFAITAAGQTVIEATKCRLPCIAIKIANNQDNNVKFWNENGSIFYAGDYQEINIYKNIENKISEINIFNNRKKIILRAAKLFEKNGVLNIIEKVCNEFYYNSYNKKLEY